jgi:H+-transporting ATPase
MLLGDIATFALAKDQVIPSTRPDRWAVRSLAITGSGFAALLFAASGGVFWLARYSFALTTGQTQTAVFLWLVFAGAQAALYLARARGAFWARPHPGKWLLGTSAADILIAAILATQGWLMTPISWAWAGTLLGASIAFLAIGNALRLAATAIIHRSAPARTGPPHPGQQPA